MCKYKNRRDQQGFSLAEVLVASTVFLLVVLAVYTIYDMGQRSYKRGSQAADLQQRVRIVQDAITRDLRLTGYDSLRDMNGNNVPDQTDEQIEGAWKHAITIRGNFNFEEMGEDSGAGEEVDYKNDALDITYVSTSNEEIVTYALANANTSESTDLQVDLSKPRNSQFGSPITGEESVQITNIALSNTDDPPYTLYKYVYSDPDSALGGAPMAIPIADNIRSLEFKYYDAAGIEIVPGDTYDSISIPTNGIGGANLIGTASARLLREAIAKVEVIITGMSEAIDPKWVNDPTVNPAADVTDPYAPNHRLFTLSTVIYPSNMGQMLQPQTDLNAPDPPDTVHVHPGLYNWLVVDWAYDNPGKPKDQGVFEYKVELYDAVSTGGSPITIATVPATMSTFERMTFDDSVVVHGSDYIVQVWAVDSFDNVSKHPGYTDSSEMANNTTTPEIPTNVKASGVTDTTIPATEAYTDDIISITVEDGNPVLDGKVTLSWIPPSENTTDTAVAQDCEFGDFLDYLDAGGFNIYRVKAKGSAGSIEASDTNQSVGVTEDPAMVTTAESFLWNGSIDQTANLLAYTGSSATYVDETTIPCDLYVYAVQAVDAENNPSISNSDVSNTFLGYAAIDGTLVPEKPENLSLVSTANSDGTFFDLEFTWDPVGVPESTSTIWPTNDYVIFEYKKDSITMETVVSMIPVFDVPVDSPTTKVIDRLPKAMSGDPQESRQYTVAAYNPCNFTVNGPESDPVTAPFCAFMGSFASLVQLTTDPNPCSGSVEIYALGRATTTETEGEEAPLPLYGWVEMFSQATNSLLCGRTQTQISGFTDIGGGTGVNYKSGILNISYCIPNYEGTMVVIPYVEDTNGCVMQGFPVTCVTQPGCCIVNQDSYAPAVCINQFFADTLVMKIRNVCSSPLSVKSLDLNYSYSKKGLLNIWWNGSEKLWQTDNINNNNTEFNGDQDGGNFQLITDAGFNPILGPVGSDTSEVFLTLVFSSAFSSGDLNMGISINYSREAETATSTCNLGTVTGIATCSY